MFRPKKKYLCLGLECVLDLPNVTRWQGLFLLTFGEVRMIRYFKNTTHGCHTSDDVKCSMNNYSWKFLSFWFSSFYINILINFFSFSIENRDRIMSSSSYRHVMDIPNWESWDTESTDLLYENNMATEGWMLPCDRIRQILLVFTDSPNAKLWQGRFSMIGAPILLYP